MYSVEVADRELELTGEKQRAPQLALFPSFRLMLDNSVGRDNQATCYLQVD
jgi:hypothetical protein